MLASYKPDKTNVHNLSSISSSFPEISDISAEFTIELNLYCMKRCNIKDTGLFQPDFLSLMDLAFDYGFLKGLDIIYDRDKKRKYELENSLKYERKYQRSIKIELAVIVFLLFSLWIIYG